MIFEFNNENQTKPKSIKFYDFVYERFLCGDNKLVYKNPVKKMRRKGREGIYFYDNLIELTGLYVRV